MDFLRKSIIKKDASIFDILSVAILLAGLLLSIFLTKIDIYFIAISLPIILLIKKLCFKASLREALGLETERNWFDIFKKDHKLNSQAIILIYLVAYALIPVLIELYHGDFNIERSSHWLNSHNSFWVVLFYLSASYVVNVGKNIFNKIDNLKLTVVSLIFSSFLIDFAYGVFKAINHLNNFNRWEGSANNPNTWAIQASLVLILMLASDSLFFNNTKTKKSNTSKNHLKKIIYYLLLFVPFMGIYFAGSFSNILGIFVALMAILIPSTIYLMFYLLIIGTITLNLFVLFGDVGIFKELGVFGKKLIPRAQLWSYIPDFINYENFNWLIGAGFKKYQEWTSAIDPRGSDHIHNSYFHHLLLYGIPGLYFAYAYLFLLKENLLKVFFEKNLNSKTINQFLEDRKFYFAIMFFVILISNFDCSFFFYENQILFWTMLPVLTLVVEK